VTKLSAGILLFRRSARGLEVLLVHPGGPYWAKKDLGAWSIPKGEHTQEEDALSVAKREFEEELGVALSGTPHKLGAATQRGGKRVIAWAVEGDFDPSQLRSNTFAMEWPPKSGRQREFPEVDRAAWMDIAEARQKMLEAQTVFLDRLIDLLEPGT
jgi:predicted NUDIX family NTP pyrophosphohydrolase